MRNDVDLGLIYLVARILSVSQFQRARRANDLCEKRDALDLSVAAFCLHKFLTRKSDITHMSLGELCHQFNPKVLRELVGCMAHGLGWAEVDAALNAKGSSLQDYFSRKGIDGPAWLADLEKRFRPLNDLCDRLDEILAADTDGKRKEMDNGT